MIYLGSPQPRYLGSSTYYYGLYNLSILVHGEHEPRTASDIGPRALAKQSAPQALQFCKER